MDILCAIIMGLGESSTGDLLGLRSFIDSMMLTTSQISLLTAAWDNPTELLEISLETHAYDRDILIGHSHGGHRAVEIASGMYGEVDDDIECLIVLDPKPPLFEHFPDFINWGYEYPVPERAKKCISIHGGFGCPFKSAPNVTNIVLSIGHAQFPSDPTVQEVIRANIEELLTTGKE